MPPQGRRNIQKIHGGKADRVHGRVTGIFYYRFGDNDVYAIVDVPDEATMIALSLAANGTGALSLKTTVLVEPEVIDEASAKAINYRSPGQ